MACQKKSNRSGRVPKINKAWLGTNDLNMVRNPAPQLPVLKQKNTTATGTLGLVKTKPIPGCILTHFKNFEILPRHWVTEHIFGC